MNKAQRGDRLREWLINHGPLANYWKKYRGPGVIDKNEEALSDLQNILNQDSEEDIASYFADIKSELKAKAIAADAECEDQPVPKGWPEPSD